MTERQDLTFKKGRGAQLAANNRFSNFSYEKDAEYLEYLMAEGEDVAEPERTRYIKVFPKSIINKVVSPDIGHEWSMNPYQGCEHGCTYCYARNSHEFWGYNASVDFEQKVLIKENAPALLEKALQKKSWKGEPIMLSGNTDCYQPAERTFEITRRMLEVCLKYNQPVGIITKNALIIRDLDILVPLAKKSLVRVVLSITSLDEDLRRKLEPRTASAQKKLQAIKVLNDSGVPTGVMIAPIIPGLNSHEVFDIARRAAEHGALSMNYTMVRLNGIISEIFLDWLDHHFPDRADKVKHLIEQTHGGQLNDSQFGRRMRGEGQVAEQVSRMMKIARARFYKDRKMPDYDRSLFEHLPQGQMRLF